MGGAGRKQDKEDRASEHEVHLIKSAQWGAFKQSFLLGKSLPWAKKAMTWGQWLKAEWVLKASSWSLSGNCMAGAWTVGSSLKGDMSGTLPWPPPPQYAKQWFIQSRSSSNAQIFNDAYKNIGSVLFM